MDVYGIGAILYQILSGAAPYCGRSSDEILQKVRTLPPPKPSEVNPPVPRALEAICLKAMARRPEDRYSNAVDVAVDVQHWLDDEPVSSCPELPWERAFRWMRRHPTVTVSGLAAIVTLLAAVTLGTVLVQRERVKALAATRLAADNARRAAEAETLAAQKEVEATRLAREANEARLQASNFSAVARLAMAEADAARTRVTQLETQLESRTQREDSLEQQLEAARGKLAAAQSRAATEAARAAEALRRAGRLEHETEELREEARQLRALAARLLALSPAGQALANRRHSEQVSAQEDFTDAIDVRFAVAAADGSMTIASFDAGRKLVGSRSLRVDSLSRDAVCVTVSPIRFTSWDLSGQEAVMLSVLTEDAAEERMRGITLRIGHGSNYFEYRPAMDLRVSNNGEWWRATIPLTGSKNWSRTTMNRPRMTSVDWIEIHVSQGYGRFWLDGVECSSDISPPLAIAPFDAEQAKQHQHAWAEYLGVPAVVTNSLGMQFTLIPPGEFAMGSSSEEMATLLQDARAKNQPEWYISRLPAETPKHRVRISRAFYLGQCEVTQSQYARVMVDIPHRFSGDTTRPVEVLDWDDASAFCRSMNALAEEQAAGAEYRLPTEAEWEYACRAGTTTWWGCGDEAALKEHAWFSANSEGRIHPVGQKVPNPWGLHDIQGNAWEWCAGWFESGDYENAPWEDPQGPSQGRRVFRGGSWHDDSPRCRAAFRFWRGSNPFRLGFRLVRSVP